jgi:hypothetical protein
VLTAETDHSAAVVRRPADGQGRTVGVELAVGIDKEHLATALCNNIPKRTTERVMELPMVAPAPVVSYSLIGHQALQLSILLMSRRMHY